MTFKVGDKVKLVTAKWGDDTCNPIWGGYHGHIIGVVCKLRPDDRFIYNIKWDNGRSNAYKDGNLELIKETQNHFSEELFKL